MVGNILRNIFLSFHVPVFQNGWQMQMVLVGIIKESDYTHTNTETKGMWTPHSLSPIFFYAYGQRSFEACFQFLYATSFPPTTYFDHFVGKEYPFMI